MINDLLQIHNVNKLLISQGRYSEAEFFLKHVAYESLQILGGMYNHLGDYKLAKKSQKVLRNKTTKGDSLWQT